MMFIKLFKKMMFPCLGIGLGISTLLLAGCVTDSFPPQMRHQNAVTQTGARMATRLALAAHWGKDASNQLVMVREPAIYNSPEHDSKPPVNSVQLRNALVYGLLHLKNPPHAIAWAPKDNTGLQENQWLLEARMFNKTPEVKGKHTIYPYRLEMRLYHPHQRPLSLVIQGNFDSQDLRVAKTSNDS